MKASASASLTKFWSLITQGACSPCREPGDDIARGEYCGKSLKIRLIVVVMPPGSTAGGVLGGRAHRPRFSAQRRSSHVEENSRLVSHLNASSASFG